MAEDRGWIFTTIVQTANGKPTTEREAEDHE